MTSGDQRRIGGRYLLVRPVGSGGMGTVWQARDETLRRDVAVKVLRLQPGVDETERLLAVERAMREARIAARLHHPNAVQVYDVVDDEHGPSLILQYVPSRSLATVVAEEGPLAPHDAARVGTQLAAALAAAHRVGIVHRDIKPGNVLIADDGTVKITDFGVSHAFDDVTITSTGLVTGTPAYLAPEVARGEQSTVAADVYSLGSTLYFAVEGHAPYGEEGNPMAVLHRVASGRPEPPRHAGALTSLLDAMMSADPAARPSMVEIAGRLPDLHPLTADGAAPDRAVTQQLRALPAVSPAAPAVRAGSPTVATGPRPVPLAPPPGPDSSRRRRKLLLPLAAAVIVVLIGAIVAVAVLRSSTSGHRVAERRPLAPTNSSTAPSSSPSSSRSTSTPPSSFAAPVVPPPAPETSTPPPTSTDPPQPVNAAAPTSDQLTAAIADYFSLIPGDLDAGWNRLTPSFQEGRAGGRSSYDDYWHTVDHVDVGNLRGDAPRTVRANLTYHYDDGSVVDQKTTFRLKREDGILKIDKQS